MCAAGILHAFAMEDSSEFGHRFIQTDWSADEKPFRKPVSPETVLYAIFSLAIFLGFVYYQMYYR